MCAIHFKALSRLENKGKSSNDDDENVGANLGKIVNLMQCVICCLKHLGSYVPGVIRTLYRNDSGSFLLSSLPQSA